MNSEYDHKLKCTSTHRYIYHQINGCHFYFAFCFYSVPSLEMNVLYKKLAFIDKILIQKYLHRASQL